MEWKKNELHVDTYLQLRQSVKWKKLTRQQAQLALDRSLYTVCVYDEDIPVAMGRLVGDGVVICYVQDLVVRPEYQSSGIGGAVLESLIAYAKEMQLEQTELMLALMCAKGREEFYEKYGFLARPTENLGPGMIQYFHK